MRINICSDTLIKLVRHKDVVREMVGNMYGRIIRNFNLLVVAIRSFSMFVNCLHAIASLRLIAFVPSTLTLVGSVHPFTSIIF